MKPLIYIAGPYTYPEPVSEATLFINDWKDEREVLAS